MALVLYSGSITKLLLRLIPILPGLRIRNSFLCSASSGQTGNPGLILRNPFHPADPAASRLHHSANASAASAARPCQRNLPAILRAAFAKPVALAPKVTA